MTRNSHPSSYTTVHEASGPMCERCQGNGELVTDWERYLHGPLDEDGNDAVEDCPDCNGTGHVVDEAQSKDRT